MNSIMCKICGDILSSYHVHDFKRCSCKLIGIDGGLEYKNRTGSPMLIHEITSLEEYIFIENLSVSDRVNKFCLEKIPLSLHETIYFLVQKNRQA